jgi:hypothetical protein
MRDPTMEISRQHSKIVKVRIKELMAKDFHRNILRSLLCSLVVLAPLQASANDSTAVLAAGGLRLEKSNDIVILSEKLRVSPSKITVDYEMQNVSKQPIDTIIAFPMPLLEGPQLVNVPVDVKKENPENFLDFKTTVDGVAIQPKQEVKAFLMNEDGTLGRDVTAELTDAKILVSPVEPNFFEKIQALPADVKRKLVASKLLFGEGDDYTPLWAVQYHYYSPQRFDSNKVVKIRHEYRPAAGVSLFGASSIGEDTKKWCMDGGTEKAVRKLLVKGTGAEGEEKYIMQKQVDYILKTGANWSGPIRSFELTIAKDKPSQVVSLCGVDIERVSDTEFLLTRNNFSPVDDLSVAFYDTSFE